MIRGRFRRARCHHCGRDIACSYNWEMGQWILKAHLQERRGMSCPGWRADREALVPLEEAR